MNVEYDRRFLRDLAAIPKAPREAIERLVFELLPAVAQLSEIPQLRRLHAPGRYFRIRSGSYRIGLEQTEAGISLRRVLHRREIYRFFP